MASIALLFIACHMLGDYILQTNWMAKHKLPSGWDDYTFGAMGPSFGPQFWSAAIRTKHVFLYALGFIPIAVLTHMTGRTEFLFIGSIFIPHWIIDCRRWASPVPWAPKPILVDQTLHAICLALTAVAFKL